MSDHSEIDVRVLPVTVEHGESFMDALRRAFDEAFDDGECSILGSGQCCHDVHYDIEGLSDAARAALPHEHRHLCGEDPGKSQGLSIDPDEVTCQSCLERIYA